MSDLIRREDVMLRVREFIGNKSYNELMLVNDLNALLSAESEREKGKWIDEKINSYTSRTYCSECGSSAPFVYKSDDYYGNHAHGETTKTKFCPNCGARMELE